MIDWDEMPEIGVGPSLRHVLAALLAVTINLAALLLIMHAPQTAFVDGNVLIGIGEIVAGIGLMWYALRILS